MIVRKNIPKFRSANYIKVLSCEKYLNVTSNFTPYKKASIAYIMFVLSVIKLKLDKLFQWLCFIRFFVIQ